ncbi:MAG: DUF4340 domain-containing protein [Candidatus Sumerlaeaceae bacterium]|nr:DUF4340 domain-containing protein [Candidatus Sumerlaeaceae bacterium]
MSTRRTLFAAAIFVLSVMLYYLDQKIADTKIVQAINEQSLAPGINQSEVIEINLHNAQGDVTLKKESGQWRTVKPSQAPADSEVVDQLLINVTAARRRNDLDVKNLAEYGLAAPEITVQIKTESGRTFDLLIGNESTYTGQVFAKYPGDQKVFTVGEQVRSVLMRHPSDFRRARVLEVDTGDLESYESVSIKSAEGEVRLQQDKGAWRITSPITSPADAATVVDYLRKAGLLKAAGFIGQQTDKPVNLTTALQALTSPTLQITLTRSQNRVTRLIVAQAGEPDAPILLAQREANDEVMVIRRETLEALNQDENNFRSKVLFTLRPQDIGVFSIEILRSHTDLSRNAQGLWEFVGDPGRKVDQEQVNNRLETLLRLKAKQYVDVSPRDATVYDLLPPKLKFTLTDTAKQRTEGLEVGRSEPGSPSSVYARRLADPGVFTMDISPELYIVPNQVADRKFLWTPLQQVAKLAIQLGDKKYELKREKGAWTILKPGQTVFAPTDTAKADRLMAMINALEYERDFSAEGQTVIAASEAPSMTLDIQNDKGEVLAGLSVGKRLKDGTIVLTNAKRSYEVRNSNIDLLVAVVQSLVQ